MKPSFLQVFLVAATYPAGQISWPSYLWTLLEHLFWKFIPTPAWFNYLYGISLVSLHTLTVPRAMPVGELTSLVGSTKMDRLGMRPTSSSWDLSRTDSKWGKPACYGNSQQIKRLMARHTMSPLWCMTPQEGCKISLVSGITYKHYLKNTRRITTTKIQNWHHHWLYTKGDKSRRNQDFPVLQKWWL